MKRAGEPEADLASLARRARDGESAAFCDWIRATRVVVFKVALRMVSNAQGAEDVTQEAYVRAWQNMARLKEPRASLAWICRITRNVATDHLRRPSRRETAQSDAGDLFAVSDRSFGPDPEEALLSGEERAQVRDALVALRPKYRVALLLREVDGLTYDEIAASMGVPRGTVESRIHRARAQVRKSLERARRRQAGSER